MTDKQLARKARKAKRKAQAQAEANFIKLIERLNSDTRKERQEAEQFLQEHSEEVSQELRVRLEKQSRDRRKLPLQWLHAAVLAGIAMWAGSYLINILWPSPHGGMPYHPVLTVMIVMMWQWKKQRNQMTRALARFNDIRNIGVLAEALGYGTHDTRLAARNALLRLLPRMRASDAGLLTPPQRERLTRMLNGTDTAFILVLLKAYEQIGGPIELAAVMRMAQKPRLEFPLREAAEICLPFLRLRAQQTQGSDTLLRAAECATAPDTLLRAADNSETNPAQLLRSSDA